MKNRRPLRPEELFDEALKLRERAERAEAEVIALRTMAIELVKELIAKCDDPIHREQLASLSEASSLQPSV